MILYDINNKTFTRSFLKTQVNKAAQVTGCLKDLILRNKYMAPETKVRMYKTAV